MKANMKPRLFAALSLLASMVWTILFWAIGYILRRPSTLWIVLLCTSAVLILAIAVFQCVVAKRKLNHMRSLSSQEMFDLGMKVKSETEQDYDAATKKLFTKIRHCYTYLAAVLLLFALFAFCIGMTGMGAGGAIPLCLLAMFLSTGLFAVPIHHIEHNERPSKTLLAQNVYPLLYALANKAAAAVDCRQKILLSFASGGISVCEQGGFIHIQLDPTTLSILTKDELYNVLLHEFAHAVHRDTLRLSKLSGASIRWSPDAITPFHALSHTLFLSACFMSLLFDVEGYRAVSSRYYEGLADALVKRVGSPQTYIDATAKCSMLSFANGAIDPQMNYEFYRTETLPTDYIECCVRAYRNLLASRREVWTACLKKEIPARVDSHPTLRMRMAVMETDDFCLDTVETDAAYIAECDLLAAHVSALLVEVTGDDYAEQRKELFTKRNETIAEHAHTVALGNTIATADALLYAETYMYVDPQKAIDLFQDLLAREAKLSTAQFQLGRLLLDRCDEACFEHFYKAAEDVNMSEDAYMLLGHAALLLGRQDILDDYRNRMIAAHQQSMDTFKHTANLDTKLLQQHGLNAETVRDIRTAITKIGGGDVVSVHLVKRRATKDCAEFYPILFKLSNDLSQNEYEDLMERLNLTMTTCTDGKRYVLYAFRSSPITIAICAVPFSCIYEGNPTSDYNR